VNPANRASVSSITHARSFTTMHAASSPVNWGLNVNPRRPKNAIAAGRSRTCVLRKSIRGMGDLASGQTRK
jgi:hypothetical protein